MGFVPIITDLDLHVDEPLVPQQADAVREGGPALIADEVLYLQVDVLGVVGQVPPLLEGLSALWGR